MEFVYFTCSPQVTGACIGIIMTTKVQLQPVTGQASAACETGHASAACETGHASAVVTRVSTSYIVVYRAYIVISCYCPRTCPLHASPTPR